MATKIILGDISLSPGPRRKLKFNNPRSIAKFDIPGGAPSYQDMGEDETTLAWDGVFTGDAAYATALQIEKLKNAGQPVQLIVSDFPELSRKVRITNFPWDVIRSDLVEYSIELVAEPQPSVTLQTKTSASVNAGTGVVLASASKTSPSRVHTVKQGDTLWLIAVKYLGNGNQWRKIATANKIMNPSSLQVGQKLYIPDEVLV